MSRVVKELRRATDSLASVASDLTSTPHLSVDDIEARVKALFDQGHALAGQLLQRAAAQADELIHDAEDEAKRIRQRAEARAQTIIDLALGRADEEDRVRASLKKSVIRVTDDVARSVQINVRQLKENVANQAAVTNVLDNLRREVEIRNLSRFDVLATVAGAGGRVILAGTTFTVFSALDLANVTLFAKLLKNQQLCPQPSGRFTDDQSNTCWQELISGAYKFPVPFIIESTAQDEEIILTHDPDSVSR